MPQSGHELRTFTGHTGEVTAAVFSSGGRTVLSGSYDNTLKLWDAATGKELRTFSGHTGAVTSVTLSSDGRTALSGSYDNTLKLWDTATGKELRTFTGHTGAVTSVALSADGSAALSGSYDKTVKLWDVISARVIRTFTGHTGAVTSVALSSDGRTALSGSFDRTLKLWDIPRGVELRTFAGHTGGVNSVAFSPAGRIVLSGGRDGTTRVWDLDSARERAATLAASGGEWLTVTPEGFFSASHRDTDMLTIVRGFEVTAAGQVQSLYNPDLVREALAGDPGGKVKRAAASVNLETVLRAGPPPAVTIVSQAPASGNGLVTVSARVTDRGKGIGRIEWRINGTVAAEAPGAPAGTGPDYAVERALTLGPGENLIEVIAYGPRNLIASEPARATIVNDGQAGDSLAAAHRVP